MDFSETPRACLDDFQSRTAYWSDPAAKAAFGRFVREIFALDLSTWNAAGFWDDDYRPFSLFDATGRVVANVCLYSMRLVVAGERVRAGQLSAVATRPGFRRRGLARALGERALAWAAANGHAIFYLLADNEAFSLYRQLGFTPIAEHAIVVRPPSGKRPAGARRLDAHDAADGALIHRLACTRCPVSRELGVLNDRLLMFNVLGPLRDAVWHIAPLDVVVLARRAGGVLTIFDVVGERMPPLAEVYPFLADPGDSEIVIRFQPDQLGDLALLGEVGSRPLPCNNLYVRGPFPVRGPVAFPITAQA